MDQSTMLGLMALRDGFGSLRSIGGGPAGPQSALPMAMQYRQQQQEQERFNTALDRADSNGTLPMGFGSEVFREFGRMNPQAAMQMLVQQRTKANDPWAGVKVVGNSAVRMGPEGAEPVYTSQPNDPASVQEYRFAVKDGFGGSYQDWVTGKAKAGGANITNSFSPNGEGPYKYGRIDPGYRVNTQTGESEPVPGSAAAREIEAKQDKTNAQADTKRRTADLMIEDIGRARGLGGQAFTTGFSGNLLSAVPSTPAHDLSQVLLGIEANIGFDRLQRMREESPTGGALGQVSDSERKALNATMGSLQQSQTQEQFTYNLNRLQRQYGETVHGPQYREMVFRQAFAETKDKNAAYGRLAELGY